MTLHPTETERRRLANRRRIRRVSSRAGPTPTGAPSGCCPREMCGRLSPWMLVARRFRMTSFGVACAISVATIGISSAALGDTVITILPPTPQQMIAPACKVEVCCKGIVGVGGLAWHCFTKCTTTFPDGRVEVTACLGSPSGLFVDQWPAGVATSPNVPPQCNGWTIVDGAWGPIDTYCGPYSNGHPDWQFPPPPCTDAASGTNCATCDCIGDVMCRIESCCVRYELLPELYGFNSNSSAFTAIDACQPSSSGPQPLPIPAPPLGAPGWSVLIPLENCPICPQ